MGGGCKERLDSRAGVRGDSHGLSHEASQVSLEAELISVAGTVRLTSSFDHDASCIIKCLEECLVDLLDQASQARLPGRRAVGVVVHDCRAIDENARVVGPLQRCDVLAVVGGASTVVDAVAVVDQSSGHSPVVDLLGPIGISTVASVARETSSHLEETSVRDRVLVVPSCI